jgi:hypothetical protein
MGVPEPVTDLDERLARLAARKTTTGAAPAKPARTRRKHPAAAGRILSLGLSSSAFFSLVGALGAQTTASGASTNAAAPPPSIARATAGPPTTGSAPRPKVVVKVVHHALYLDKLGHPIAPTSLPKGAVVTPLPSQPGGASPKPGGAGTPADSAPSAPPQTVSPAPNAPTTATPATPPATTLVPPAPQPTPTTVHVPTPTTAPPSTSPPTTVFTPPPPPPPPVCSGTRCP